MQNRELKPFRFIPLNFETVNTISAWECSESEDGFFMTPYHDSYLTSPDEMRGPGGCHGYGVFVGDTLFGLFEYKIVEEELEIGCAISPSFRSQGFGERFVKEGIEFGISKYRYSGSRVLLSVDEENSAARRVYRSAGFTVEQRDGREIRMSLTIVNKIDQALPRLTNKSEQDAADQLPARSESKSE